MRPPHSLHGQRREGRRGVVCRERAAQGDKDAAVGRLQFACPCAKIGHAGTARELEEPWMSRWTTLAVPLIVALAVGPARTRGDTAPSEAPVWTRYDVMAAKLQVGRKVDWWHGLSGSWELEGSPLVVGGPALTGKVRAEQEFTLLRGLDGTLHVAGSRDLMTSEWIEQLVEAQLRVQASPIRGLAVKLEPHAWTDHDLRHLRAAVRSSMALKLWGHLSLGAGLDSEYDRRLRQWQHSPTVGLTVNSKEFNWSLPKF